MEQQSLHRVEHGAGRPVVVLHGAGVDHRESEACFEPVLEWLPGLRRLYPDLPGMGRSVLPSTATSTEDVLAMLLRLVEEVSDGEPVVLVGHSLGGHYARAMAARAPGAVAALVRVCPLVPGAHDVPEQAVVEGDDELGDDGFRSYFVVRTREMLARYERFVAPAAALVDEQGLARVAHDWELTSTSSQPYAGPTLVVAGRWDSTVGHAAATDLLAVHPRSSLTVLDGAGHALPHEQPRLLRHLVHDWWVDVAGLG